MYSATEPVEVWRAHRSENAYTSSYDWDHAVLVWEGTASV